MPRPPYTSTRRYIMTALMWLILGATIVMAAAVTQKQKRLSRVTLDKSVTIGGNVTVRLPAKWRPRPRGEGDVRVVALAAEGMTGEEGRELRVLSERLEYPMSPLQYLSDAFGLRVPSKMDEPGRASEVTIIDIAGYPGVMLINEQTMPQFDVQGAAGRKKGIYGCAILPSLQAITIHMTGGEAGDDTDADMVRQVARAITVSRPPELEQPGVTVTLPEGITLAPPPRFAAVANSDPNRVERRLWMDEPPADTAGQREGRWTVIETVGVQFPLTDLMDGQQRERALSTLQTLLLVRDPRWRGAEPSIEGNVYRVDAPAEDNVFPSRAYLLPHDSGRALLTIFHGGFGSEGQFDGAWAQMLKSVKFLPAAAQPMKETGAAEALRLRSLRVTELIPDLDEQWWLWHDPSDRPLRGWTRIEMAPNGRSFKGESRVRRWGGRVTRVTEEWSVDGIPQHKTEVTRTLLAPDGSDLESVRQTVDVRPGQVAVKAQSRTTTLAQWRITSPPQFVPGSVLPQVIGRLKRDPMMLRTESFLGYEGLGTPSPLEIIVRPAESGGQMEDDQPLDCVTVQVNGSGVLSRWYIRDDDTIARIEFADGVQCTPSDKKAIEFSFAKDGQMSLKK